MLPRNAPGNNDVVHEFLTHNPDTLGGLVRRGFPGRHEVVNPEAVEQDAMIGDQSPVAPPPKGLAAHNHRTFSCRRLNKVLERREELSRPHVGGISPEGFVAKRGVRRVRGEFTEAAQPFFPAVGNTCSGQPLLKAVVAKVWELAASRRNPHVYEAQHLRFLEDLEEFTLGSSSMPHREQDRRQRVSRR